MKKKKTKKVEKKQVVEIHVYVHHKDNPNNFSKPNYGGGVAGGGGSGGDGGNTVLRTPNSVIYK